MQAQERAQPLASPRVGIYQLTNAGPILIGGNGPALSLIPNVVGQTQTDAVSTLTTSGLVVGTISTQHSGVPAGLVIAQTPAANTSVAAGTAVQLLVSLGPSIRGDINGDGNVDQDDLNMVLAARNTVAAPGDPRDLDGDSKVTALDARILTTLCTRTRCATK